MVVRFHFCRQNKTNSSYPNTEVQSRVLIYWKIEGMFYFKRSDTVNWLDGDAYIIEVLGSSPSQITKIKKRNKI